MSGDEISQNVLKSADVMISGYVMIIEDVVILQCLCLEM